MRGTRAANDGFWCSNRPHPRVCGEHPDGAVVTFDVDGSSPRMRGTPASWRAEGEVGGLIPAYAGNTGGRRRRRRSGPAHPRVCGEHLRNVVMVVHAVGSSPRMRGTLQDQPKRRAQPGLIPAYAGNTGRSPPCAWGHLAHPRVCGEHTPDDAKYTPIRGSSPRMRGTLGNRVRKAMASRLIPAYAGNTSGQCPTSPPCAAHPRVCGEHGQGDAGAAVGGGSSPRMRGTHRRDPPVRQLLRLIPAYAGNTRSEQIQRPAGLAHPRVCGEHPQCSTHGWSGCGSSPRMRGTPSWSGRPARWSRLIPAYAGNTHGPGWTGCRPRAHPRVCEEHAIPRNAGDTTLGSSPRMRGTRVRS